MEEMSWEEFNKIRKEIIGKGCYVASLGYRE
jgi:hypothetical protein